MKTQRKRGFRDSVANQMHPDLDIMCARGSFQGEDTCTFLGQERRDNSQHDQSRTSQSSPKRLFWETQSLPESNQDQDGDLDVSRVVDTAMCHSEHECIEHDSDSNNEWIDEDCSFDSPEDQFYLFNEQASSLEANDSEEEALVSYLHAFHLAIQMFGQDSQECISVLRNMSQVVYSKGEYASALEIFELLHSLQQRSQQVHISSHEMHDNDAIDEIYDLIHIGDCHEMLGDHEHALTTFQHALDATRRHLGSMHYYAAYITRRISSLTHTASLEYSLCTDSYFESEVRRIRLSSSPDDDDLSSSFIKKSTGIDRISTCDHIPSQRNHLKKFDDEALAQSPFHYGARNPKQTTSISAVTILILFILSCALFSYS